VPRNEDGWPEEADPEPGDREPGLGHLLDVEAQGDDRHPVAHRGDADRACDEPEVAIS
jgi:hypothetical protein